METALIVEVPAGLTPQQLSVEAYRALARLLREECCLEVMPDIVKDSNGKPWFPSRPDLHFSVSHCRSAVMVAISSQPVGCDIEDIVTDDDVGMLLEVAFSDEDRERILAASDPRKELTRLWTIKESNVKRHGVIPDDPRLWPSMTIPSELSANTHTPSATPPQTDIHQNRHHADLRLEHHRQLPRPSLKKYNPIIFYSVVFLLAGKGQFGLLYRYINHKKKTDI